MAEGRREAEENEGSALGNCKGDENEGCCEKACSEALAAEGSEVAEVAFGKKKGEDES